MAAIHVILDERERPVELRFDQGPMRLHHASISFDGHAFDGRDEIRVLAVQLATMLLKAVHDSETSASQETLAEAAEAALAGS